jgi:thiol-disulfide isomerase/thioredoxin
MKRILVLLLALTVYTTASAQKPYTTSKDEETGAVIFKGPITTADLSSESSFSWYNRGRTAYVPDSGAIKYLRTALPNYTLVTLMGTWCDDSQNLVPRLAKVLEASRYPMNKFVMYGVDRSKQTNGIEGKLYDVKKVPTIIVFKGNKEIGRIVENVTRSVEVDMVQIIEKASQQ